MRHEQMTDHSLDGYQRDERRSLGCSDNKRNVFEVCDYVFVRTFSIVFNHANA